MSGAKLTLYLLRPCVYVAHDVVQRDFGVSKDEADAVEMAMAMRDFEKLRDEQSGMIALCL